MDGKEIRRQRHALDLTQVELARRARELIPGAYVNQRVISMMEHGWEAPDITRAAITAAFAAAQQQSTTAA